MTRKTTTIMVESAECATITHSIEKVLCDVPGVLHAYANPVTEAAYVEYDGDRCNEADLVSAVESLGIRVAHPTRR